MWRWQRINRNLTERLWHVWWSGRMEFLLYDLAKLPAAAIQVKACSAAAGWRHRNTEATMTD